jgi:response regulator of citrate/malate metabolism
VISVVVVDDDFRVARIHSSFLSRIEGFTVVGVANTGREALEVVTRLEPTLVLLDLYLPDIFGLDLLNQLRVRGARPDVIVITAANESETVQQAVQLGVVSYLLKPFRFPELQRRLETYRDQRSASRSHRIGDQSTIDQLFGRSSEPLEGPLPKGLSAETARMIMTALAGEGGAVSASECAARVGVARVSARRYLEYFASQGLVDVALRYGTTGRPERQYRLLPRSGRDAVPGTRPDMT